MTMRGKGEKPLPFKLHQDEYLVTCPYNMSHQVTNFRMMTHLLKCRRNHERELCKKGDTVLMMVCKYNWLHQVPSPEILFHEQNCQDQYNVVPHLLEYVQKDPENPEKTVTKYELYLTTGAATNYLPKEGEQDKPVGSSAGTSGASTSETQSSSRLRVFGTDDGEEDWEEDCKRRGYKSYNPADKLENEVLMKYPRNLTKSERRAFLVANMEKAKRLFSPAGFETTPRASSASSTSGRHSVTSAVSMESFEACNVEVKRNLEVESMSPDDDDEELSHGHAGFGSAERYQYYLDANLTSGLEDLRIREEKNKASLDDKAREELAKKMKEMARERTAQRNEEIARENERIAKVLKENERAQKLRAQKEKAEAESVKLIFQERAEAKAARLTTGDPYEDSSEEEDDHKEDDSKWVHMDKLKF